MIQAILKTVQCLSPAGLHTMAYKEWGDPRNPTVLVCVHGLTRVSDDFDNLARALCERYRVICPDVVGRGRSSWLRDPQYYHVPQYISDMVTLLARADAGTLHWVGTSMGGLIGMGLAALPDSPVRKLALNDVGSTVNTIALARIGDYLALPLRFQTFDEAVQYVRGISVPFGPHTEEEWRKLAGDVLRQDKDGLWILHYDPGLGIPFKTVTPENAQRNAAILQMTYDAITCPTLLLRGAESDLLTSEVAQAMTQRGPKAKLVEFAGVGHAPSLTHDDQIEVVKNFLID